MSATSTLRTHRKAAAALAGTALLGTAAIALPSLAGADDSGAPATAPAVDAATSSVATETIAAATDRSPLAGLTAEQRVAFFLYTATPEQRLAFTFYVATPEERAALVAFLTGLGTPLPTPAPAPATAPRPATPQVTTPKQATGNQSTYRATTGGGSPPNGFLACVRNRESHGSYGVVNGSSGAAGAYQFMPGTARAVAGMMGRSDLAGRPTNTWSAADQDAAAATLYAHSGRAPWAGPGC